jgi:hypothetical protein
MNSKIITRFTQIRETEKAICCEIYMSFRGTEKKVEEWFPKSCVRISELGLIVKNFILDGKENIFKGISVADYLRNENGLIVSVNF